MRKFLFPLSLIVFTSISAISAGDLIDPGVDQYSIHGEYLEVRTADVWTGPCFANGEVNLVGSEGILAWKVKKGSWQGVPLEGLKVVAVISANSTLGDPFSNQLPAKSVIIIDERANLEQRNALVSFVKEMGGRLVEDVVWIKSASIEMDTGDGSGKASLKAGEIAEVRTRALNHHDMHCGNEFVYYPPLTDVKDAKPAYALANRFSEKGLNTTWSCPLKRSAFTAVFAR